MLPFILAIIVLILAWLGRIVWVAAGQSPSGERLERCRTSANWHNGQFSNLHTTPQMTGNDGLLTSLWKFLFSRGRDIKPETEIDAVKTDFRRMSLKDNVVVWLGHSSVYIQLDNKRILVDPVLTSQFPSSLMMSPFEGTQIYSPDDIPDVDYLIITHDHWDHLDYPTVSRLKSKVKNVVCPLGVGQHFEYWGYSTSLIHEMDWQDSVTVDDSLTIHCLPARHFSGRLLKRNQSLWASFMIVGSKTLFLSGDGGYDSHFADIGRRFPAIDFAFLENGQYSENWKYIHTLPSQLPDEVKELNPLRFMTIHNSKFALADHRWSEPLDKIAQVDDSISQHLLTPKIGQVIYLDKSQNETDKWW